MKILSNKKWKEINEQYVDVQLLNADLKSDNDTYRNQVNTIVDINRELNNTIALMEEELTECKKEIRKLKTLCTKNKIDYKSKKEK